MSISAPRLPDPTAPDSESRPGLLRALGPGMAIAIVVGNVIGSGIFYKPGAIAAAVGDFPLIILTWVVGGGICILGALCFAELGVMLPRAGGLYVYLREAYGRPVAFLYGWTEFFFGKPASTGALAVAFVGALAEAAAWKLSITTGVMLSLALILALSWVNVIGVIWGGRVQAATTLVKAGFLGFVAVLPFILSAAGAPGADAANYRTTIVPTESTLATQFAAAMLAVMWAYNGWHGIAPVAEEVRNPERNIPLALFGGLGILIVLYVGANLAYHGVLSMSEMKAAGENAAQDMVRKLLLPSGSGVAQLGVALMSAVIMCSTLGAINSHFLETPRVAFAMGRDDVFFRGLGLVHVNYRTPAIAIIVLGLLSAGFVVGSAVLVETVDSLKQTQTGVFKLLTGFVVFSASLFYMLAVLAVIVLRWRHPEWPRPYRTPGYPLVPVAYLAFYSWFLYYVYNGTPDSRFLANVGLALVALGIPVYYAWHAWAARHPQTMHDGM